MSYDEVYHYGDKVEVELLGDWHRGTALGEMEYVSGVGQAIRVKLDGYKYEHAFYIESVHKVEPNDKELFLKAVSEAHGCGEDDYDGCNVVQLMEKALESLESWSEENANDLYAKLAKAVQD